MEEIKMSEDIKNKNIISDEQLDKVTGGGAFISSYVKHKGYKCRVYMAAYGDDLSTIAQNTGVDIALIAQLNDITEQTRLRAGDRLYIPQ